MQFIHNLGSVLERTTQPTVSTEAEILLDAMLMFVRYYETNEHFDLLTHGIGPGVVAVVMHSFSEFMGDIMGTRLDCGVKYSGKRLFQHMYFEKLKNIVNSIVVDETDQYSGKLQKRQEDKVGSSAPQGGKKKGKHQKSEVTVSSEDKCDEKTDDEDEVVEVSDDNMSCSSNENDFSTLTSTDGNSYHPPSRRTAKSKYAGGGKSGDEAVELMEKAASKFQHKIDSQQRTIDKLMSENNSACEKLKEFRAHHLDAPIVASTSGSTVIETKKKKKQSKIVGFIPTQLLNDGDLGATTDDEVMSIDEKPDSTQKSVMVPTPAGSDGDESVVIPSTQMVKKKRQRLDSDMSTRKADIPLNVSDA